MTTQRQELLNDIQDITDAFYQNRIRAGATQLPEVIPKLAQVAEEMDTSIQSRYISALKNMTEAIELKNYVMIADILTFDILELLEE